MEVEQTPIDAIRPYERNPRVIPEIAVRLVAKSIEQYGWRQPIVVDKDGAIVVGHVRHAAARHLGLAEVPVHRAIELTPEQARAYRIADNRSAEETDWDAEALGAELLQLQADGLTEEVDALWSPDELEALLGSVQFEPPDGDPLENCDVETGPQRGHDSASTVPLIFVVPRARLVECKQALQARLDEVLAGDPMEAQVTP